MNEGKFLWFGIIPEKSYKNKSKRDDKWGICSRKYYDTMSYSAALKNVFLMNKIYRKCKQHDTLKVSDTVKLLINFDKRIIQFFINNEPISDQIKIKQKISYYLSIAMSYYQDCVEIINV